MSRCTNCGAPSERGAAYCATCGRSVTATPGARPGPWPTGTGPTGGGMPGGMASGVTGADWSAAAVSAVAGLGALALLPLLLVLALVGAGAPADPISMVGLLSALALGGSVDGSIGPATFSLSAMPLGATLLGVLALGLVFLRRGRDAPAPVLLRRAVLAVGLFTAGGLLFAAVGQVRLDQTSLVGALASAAGVEFGASIGPTVLGALLLGSLSLAGAIAWRRPEVLPAAARRWRDRLAGPIAGVLVAVVLAGLLVTVFGAATGVTGLARTLATAGEGLATGTGTGGSTTGASTGSSGPGAAFAAILTLIALPVLLAPHVALLAATAGAGAPLAVDVDRPLVGASPRPTLSLFSELSVPGVVALLVLVVLALLVGATVAALWSPGRDHALRRGWELGPVLAVTTLGAALVTGVGVDGRVLGLTTSGSVHLDALLAPLLMLAWGAALGTGGALLAPMLPAGLVTAFRARFVKVPDATATPPSGFPLPAPGRSSLAVAAGVLVLVLAVLSGLTAYVSTTTTAGADGPLPPVPLDPPTTYTPFTTTRSPTTVPTAPTAPTAPAVVGGVSLAPTAASHPDAVVVQSALARYFAAINAHDYDAWTATVATTVSRDQPRGEWLTGYRSTVDDEIVVQDIATSGSGTDLASVTYRSLQDPADAPAGLRYPQLCWSTQLPVTSPYSGGLVGAAPRGTTTGQPC